MTFHLAVHFATQHQPALADDDGVNVLGDGASCCGPSRPRGDARPQLPRQNATVDNKVSASHVRGVVAHKERHDCGNLTGLSKPSPGNLFQSLRLEGCSPGWLSDVRVDEARMHRVHPHARSGPVHRAAARHRRDGALGSVVGDEQFKMLTHTGTPKIWEIKIHEPSAQRFFCFQEGDLWVITHGAEKPRRNSGYQTEIDRAHRVHHDRNSQR